MLIFQLRSSCRTSPPGFAPLNIHCVDLEAGRHHLFRIQEQSLTSVSLSMALDSPPEHLVFKMPRRAQMCVGVHTTGP